MKKFVIRKINQKNKIDLRSSRNPRTVPAAVADGVSHRTVVQTTGQQEEPKSQE